MSGCQARVADHTDFVDCGDEILRGGKCAQHLQEEVRVLLRKIREAEIAIADYRDRLAQLNNDSG